MDTTLTVAEKPDSVLVSRVEIIGLHGLYDYDLSLDRSEGTRRLALLYGDNGSGKTTILRLLWDVLSPSNTSDHRKRIADVAFSRFVVHLGGGYRIEIERPLPVAGPYVLEVKEGSRLQSRSEWPEKGRFDEYFDDWSLEDFENRLTPEFNQNDDIAEAASRVRAKRQYIAFLEDLGAAPYFLADDRSTASDDFARDGERDPRVRVSRLGSQPVADDSSRLSSRRLAKELETSVRRVNIMLQQLALGGAASGSANANSVYLDIVKQIGAPSATASEDFEIQRERLVRDIQDLGEKSLSFENFGLIPKFVGKEFMKAIEGLSASRVEVAVSVLRPYLESLVARLEGLSEAHDLISTFLRETNSFLSGKSVTYTSRLGLRIRLDSGEELRPEQLSSGECHIILLLCNAVLARDGSRLFLIDEPELSLNVKWQRRVVGALLACTSDSSVQFVIATHSIELLASFRSNVVRMSGEGTLSN